jgi:peptidyl-tRNA hydrolase
MAQVTENNSLIEQKHVLARRAERKEITREQYEKTAEQLDLKILQNTIAYMNRSQEQIRAEMEILSNVILKILDDIDTPIKKGALRMAYKKCRGSDEDDE